MGYPINVVHHNSGSTTFNLTNKQNESKENLDIIMDTRDYDIHIVGTNNWYIHTSAKDKYNHVRRNVGGSTELLSRAVYSRYKDLPEEKVISTINKDSLNYKFNNLRLGSYPRVFNHLPNVCSKHDSTIRINHLRRNDSYQAYHKDKYITSGKTLEIVEQRIATKIGAMK